MGSYPKVVARIQSAPRREKADPTGLNQKRRLKKGLVVGSSLKHLLGHEDTFSFFVPVFSDNH
jgi:hypothetical protein